MTAHSSTSSSTDVALTTLVRRAMAAEWTRLWSLPSTWWSLAAGAGIFVFIAVVAGSQHDGGSAPVWQPAQIAIIPGQFAFLLVVLLAVAGEYSTGAIRSTLQWVPRRRVLLVARTLVPVVVVAATAVAAAATANLIVWGLVGEAAEVVPRDIAISLGRIALVVAFGAALSVGLSLLFRSTAGALTTLFLLILALPIALGNSPAQILITISDHLPGRAIIATVVVDEIELPGATIAWVMAGWTLAALAAGGWSLLRRDAT